MNFCYLKIIDIFHPCYHPNIIDVLKNVQKLSASVLMTFMNNSNENEVENEKHIKNIRHK